MVISQIQTYVYQPVASNRFETHIITLYPGQYDDEIRIALDLVTIPISTGLEYEALSYTWGSTDLTHMARVVNGLTPGGILPITSNLDTVLRHLRLQKHCRILWIDAISINQANLIEKSQQVQWMGRIYKYASRVIIFLGKATDNDTDALDVLETIGRNVHIGGSSLHTIVKIRLPDPPDVLQHDGERVHRLQISLHLTKAIIALLQRPWFSRLWIIQEVRLMSNPGLSILQCGDRTLSWDHFRNGAVCFREIELTQDDCQNLKMTVHSRLLQMSRLLFKAENPSFFNYGSLHWFGCRDPRDRLYGTLSLTNEMAHVKVDYTRTTADIFEELQRHEIKVRGLWLLQYCYIDRHNPWDAASWTPNQLSFPDYIQEMRAIPTSRFAHQCEFVGEKGLRVYGVTMATVHTILDIPPPATEWSPIEGPILMLEWLQLVWSRMEAGGTNSWQYGNYHERPARKLLQLCDSLMSKTYDEANLTIGRYPRRHIKAMLIDIFTKKREKALDLSSPEFSHFMMHLHRWLTPIFQYSSSPAIFTTNTDDVGYGPASALPGDKVCAIFGCYRAMLLRFTAADAREECVVVGPTCIAGGQRSEAVLGPLPGYIFLVYDTPNNRYTFRDTRTGEMVPDPRLKRFGINGTAAGFSDSITAICDIDLPVAELKGRGISVETFTLI